MHKWNLPHLNIDLSQTSARSQLNVNSEKHQFILHCTLDTSVFPDGLLGDGVLWIGCGQFYSGIVIALKV